MKKPIFTEDQRRMFLYPELEVEKLKFKREFMKTKIGILLYQTVDRLNNILIKYTKSK